MLTLLHYSFTDSQCAVKHIAMYVDLCITKNFLGFTKRWFSNRRQELVHCSHTTSLQSLLFDSTNTIATIINRVPIAPMNKRIPVTDLCAYAVLYHSKLHVGACFSVCNVHYCVWVVIACMKGVSDKYWYSVMSVPIIGPIHALSLYEVISVHRESLGMRLISPQLCLDFCDKVQLASYPSLL